MKANHGSLIKLRRSINSDKGLKKTKHLARAIKNEKKRAHKATRRVSKREINKVDGNHKILYTPDDWNIL